MLGGHPGQCPSSLSETISPLIPGLSAARRVKLRSPDSRNLCVARPYQMFVKLYSNIFILLALTQSDNLFGTVPFIYRPLNLNPIYNSITSAI